MAEPARRQATYQDLEDVPDHLVAEILGGELVTSPRPGMGHAYFSSIAGADLNISFGRRGGGGHPGGWWILFEPELHLGGEVVVPDLAGWRRTRMSQFPSRGAATDLAPDWVCEILSPSTQRLDRVRKLPLYARERVGHAWLVDPLERYLEVFRLHQGDWLLVGQFDGQAPIRAEPFESVELDLGSWWPPADEQGGEEPG